MIDPTLGCEQLSVGGGNPAREAVKAWVPPRVTVDELGTIESETGCAGATVTDAFPDFVES